VLLEVARAVLRVRVAGIPERLHAVCQVELFGHPRREAAEEDRRVFLAVLIDELKIEERDALAGSVARVDGPHQQRALAHLPGPFDRQRLARLLDERERCGISRPREIPRIVDVERAARHRQRRRVSRRKGIAALRRPRRRNRLGEAAAADDIQQVTDEPGRVGRSGPQGVLNLVEVCIERIRERALEREAHRQDPRAPRGRRMMPRDVDLAADHLAPAGFRRQEHDQKVRLADLLLDFLGPPLPDGQQLVDEDAVTGCREAGHDLARERVIRLDVPLVA
jgi:hypothetical protein